MPKLKKKFTWAGHQSNWSECTACSLCKHRGKVVLGRGKLPADILFVGEAPGPVEDYTGKPFKGPGGNLLDEMVEAAVDLSESDELRLFYTNLVSCVPYVDGEMKTRAPEEEEVAACSKRLNELVRGIKPSGIVMVGRQTGKLAPKFIDWDFEYSIEIIHPAAILRADEALRGITAQKTILLLEEFFKRVSNAKTTKKNKR